MGFRKQEAEAAPTVSELLDPCIYVAPNRAELAQQTILFQGFLQTRSGSKKNRDFTEPGIG